MRSRFALLVGATLVAVVPSAHAQLQPSQPVAAQAGPVVTPVLPADPIYKSLGQAPMQATIEPSYGAVRPTPKVLLSLRLGTVGSPQLKRAADSLVIKRVQRPAKTATPLEQKLGRSGGPLDPTKGIYVDAEGRTIAPALYRKDSQTLESWLATRGMTQKSLDAARTGTSPKGRIKRAKRKVPRQLIAPPPPPGTVRPITDTNGLTTGPETTHAGAALVKTGTSAMWDTAPSTTIDAFNSNAGRQSDKSAPPSAQPPTDTAELDRSPLQFRYTKPVGGDISFVLETVSDLQTGRTRRSARAQQTGKLNAYDILKLGVYDVRSEVKSARVHVKLEPASTGNQNVTLVAGTQVLGTWEGTQYAFEMNEGSAASPRALPPSQVRWTSGSAWTTNNKYEYKITIPVGIFDVDIGFAFGYTAGTVASGGTRSGGWYGLETNANVSPLLGVYLELTAGIGYAGFAIGVGGHLNIIGHENGRDAATIPLDAVSTYSDDFRLQIARAKIDNPSVRGLSGYLFVFIDTWFDRYDFELFDWPGYDMLGEVTGSVREIKFDAFKDTVYPLIALRQWSCPNGPNQGGQRFVLMDGVPPNRYWNTSGADGNMEVCAAAPRDEGIVAQISFVPGEMTKPLALCEQTVRSNHWDGDVFVAPYGNAGDGSPGGGLTVATGECAKRPGGGIAKQGLGHIFTTTTSTVKVRGPGAKPERTVNLVQARMCRNGNDAYLHIGDSSCTEFGAYGSFGVVPPNQ